MVHAHVHPALHAQGAFLFERPSPSRITAISIVVALHAAAFVLLLMPMATPEAPQPRVETVIDILPIRRPEKLEVLPPPPKPERQTRLRNPVRTPAPTPPQPPIVIVEGADVAPPPGPVVDEVPVTPIIDTGPVAMERLEYASAPPPPYPPEAMRRRIEGTVLLRVLVDVDGRPLDAWVETSSGNRALDEAAQKFVLKKWRFRPAMQGSTAVQAIGLVPIKFSMR